MLPAILRVGKYMWLMFYLYFKMLLIFKLRVFMMATYHETVFGVPAVVRVPKVEEPWPRGL
jgi:hypothetical protein